MAQNSASRKRLHHRHPPPVAQVRHECDAAGPGRSSAVRLWAIFLPQSRVPTARSHYVVQGVAVRDVCTSLLTCHKQTSPPKMPSLARSVHGSVGLRLKGQAARSSLISPGGESPPRECHTLRRAPSVPFRSSATLRQIHNATMM